MGERLQQARLERGMSLMEVQQISKVQVRFLEALEIDDYDALPGLFYAKAFIRQYANAVGLNAQEMVDIFEGKAPEREVEEIAEEEPVFQEVTTKRGGKHEGKSNFLPLIILSFLAISILGGVIYIMVSSNNNSSSFTNSSFKVDNLISTSSSSSETSSETTESTSSSSSTTSSTQAEPFSLNVDNVTPLEMDMTAKNVKLPLKLSIETKQGVALAYVASPPSTSVANYPNGSTAIKGTTGELVLNKEQLEKSKVFSIKFEVYNSATRYYVEHSEDNVKMTLNGEKIDLTQITQLGQMTVNVTIENILE